GWFSFVTLGGDVPEEKVYVINDRANGRPEAINITEGISEGLRTALADVRVYSLAFESHGDTNNSNGGWDVFIGTDRGVYYDGSNFTGWRLYGERLPMAKVTDIQITPSGTLLVATYGRGVYETE